MLELIQVYWRLMINKLLFCTISNDCLVNIVDVFDRLFKVKPSFGIYLSYNLKCCCAY